MSTIARCVILMLAVVCPASIAAAQGLPDVELEVDLPDDTEDSGNLDVDDSVEDVLEVPSSEGREGGGLRSPAGVVIDHRAAIDAVRMRSALSLNELLTVVSLYHAGQVIDVQLMDVQGLLVYQVKLLDAGGFVSTAYFAASTGEPVVLAGQ